MNSWRVMELAREAWRSTYSGSLRTLLMGSVVVAVVAGATWAELSTTGRILEFSRQFTLYGGWVAVATDLEERIPRAACAAIAEEEGVVHAGSAAMTGRTTVRSTPETYFQTATVTADAVRLWAGGRLVDSDLIDGYVLGSSAARELGVRAGMLVGLGGVLPSNRVAAVLDSEARNPSAERWIIDIVPSTGFSSQCWVEFQAGLVDSGVQLLEATFANLGGRADVRPWIRADRFTFDPAMELTNRSQASAWFIGGWVVALLAWLSLWARGAEVALYRSLGTPRIARWLMGQVEMFLILLPASVASFMLTALTFTLWADRSPVAGELLIAGRSVVSLVLLAAITAPLAWLVSGRFSTAQLLKDH